MWAALTGRAKTPDPSAEYSGSDAGSIDVGPKKVLKVSIGAKETGDKVWHAVNDDEHPTLVESEDGVFRVSVRVKDFNGVSPDGVVRRSSLYFDAPNRKRIFSIQVQARFAKDVPADELVFGGVFEKKVAPPMGSWVAMKFANMIDPALKHDLYAAKPWVLSPALCAMNTVNVAPAELSWKEITERRAKGEQVSADQILGTWDWGADKEISEDSTHLFPDGIEIPYDPKSVAERRDFFGDEETRQEIVLRKDAVYNMELFGPFFNWNTFDADLGMRMSVIPPTNGQPIRLVLKSKTATYYCAQFELVDPPPGRSVSPSRPVSPLRPVSPAKPNGKA